MEIGPSLIEIDAPQGREAHWADLLKGFKAKFINISV
jgi:hypothetical protein